MSKRPNIVLITSDQHRGDTFGFEGSQVQTPHIDALAKNGTRFSAAITPNLVCQPSRASILTGQLPLTHGVCDNGLDLPEDVGERGFAGTLSKVGFETGFIGKAHFSSYLTFKPTGTPECFESTSSFAQDWNGPYMGFKDVRLVTMGHNHWPVMKPPRGQHYERWFHADGRGEERNHQLFTDLGPAVGADQTRFSALPAEWHNSTWIGNEAIDFIRTNTDRPFCLWVSFPDPHHPFDAPEPWSRLHPPDAVKLPVHTVLDLERRPWWHRASIEGNPQIEGRLRTIRTELSRTKKQTDLQLRHIISNYYGMISLIDHNVGRILAEIARLDHERDTVVVFTSDHGEWLGDHGLLFKGPMAYEGLLRVGLVLRGPGIPPNVVINDPVSTLDLMATMLEFTDVPLSNPVHSKSLRPLIEGAREARDFALSEWRVSASRCGVALDLRTVRTRRHKLTLELGSNAGELYDLINDPFEMDNLFSDPSVTSVRRELEAMIRSRPDDIRHPSLEPVGLA
jgi:arylsulfatase A-like enzyme